jgi:hypothetical protein
MTSQLDIFGGAGGARRTAATLTEGFRYQPELIGPALVQNFNWLQDMGSEGNIFYTIW